MIFIPGRCWRRGPFFMARGQADRALDQRRDRTLPARCEGARVQAAGGDEHALPGPAPLHPARLRQPHRYFRILEALSQRGLPASLAVQGEVVERYPALAKRLAATPHEWVAHGWNMDSMHFGGLPEEEERALIERTLMTLRRFAPHPITGWLSPLARSRTPPSAYSARPASAGAPTGSMTSSPTASPA